MCTSVLGSLALMVALVAAAPAPVDRTQPRDGGAIDAFNRVQAKLHTYLGPETGVDTEMDRLAEATRYAERAVEGGTAPVRDSVNSAIGLAGRATPQVHPPKAAAHHHELSSTLPRQLAAPVRRLLTATEAAEALARDAHGQLLDELEVISEDLALVAAASGSGVEGLPEGLIVGVLETEGGPGLSGIDEHADIVDPTLREASERIEDWRTGSPALAMQDEAALTLAEAIDEALPSLRSYAAQAYPAPTGRVEGCEIADHPPLLCIGGVGANHYTEDYALLIDLGGDSLHENSAGGADPAPPAPFDQPDGAGNGLWVSTTISVGGDDRYEVPPTTSGSRVAQGAGLFGIGFLVDGEGDDRYVVEASDEGDFYAGARGQGAGDYGVGVLIDLGGDDTFRLQDHRILIGDNWARGQGSGGAGLGVLVSAGGNDDFLLEAAPAEPLLDDSGDEPVVFAGGRVHAEGAGWGLLGGVGLLVSGGGADSVRVAAAFATVDPTETVPVSWACTPKVLWCFPPQGWAVGMGAAGTASAGGALFLGDGSLLGAVESASASPTGPPLKFAYGFGSAWGQLTNLAALFDAGRDTELTLAASGEHRAHAVNAAEGRVRAGESQPTPASEPAEGSWPGPSATRVAGMGYGQGFGPLATGVGLLLSAGGDNNYTARAQEIAEARWEPDTTAARAPTQVLAETIRPDVFAQGAARNSGNGFLVALGNENSYQAVSEAAAIAENLDPDSPVPTLASSAQGAWLWAQASQSHSSTADHPHRYATALISAGERNLFDAQVATETSADPAGDVRPGREVMRAQAAVNGTPKHPEPDFYEQGGGRSLLMAIALEDNRFTQTPAVDACTGERGNGLWLDCTDETDDPFALGVGYAVTDSSLSGAAMAQLPRLPRDAHLVK